MRIFLLLTTCVIQILFVYNINAQENLNALNKTYFQDFNSLGNSARSKLPVGFEIQSSKGISDTTTYAGGTINQFAFSSNSSFGVYNCADGQHSSSTDRAIGFITSSNANSPTKWELIYSFKNNTGHTVNTLIIGFDYEKYREGMRDWNMLFYHGSNSSSINVPEVTGNEFFNRDTTNKNIVNPVLSVKKHVVLKNLNIPNGGNYYLKWVYEGVGGPTNAQVLAIDNFEITLKNEPLIFRSRNNGNWNDFSSWEFKPISQSGWQNATLLPSYYLDSVIITNKNTIEINDNVILDRVFIGNGSVLLLKSGKITLVNDAKRNLVVENGGTLIFDSNITFNNTNSVCFIHSKGKLITNSKDGVDKLGGLQYESPFLQSFTFNGTEKQNTGNLPSKCSNLTVDNNSGLSLKNNIEIQDTLFLKSGIITTNSYQLAIGVSPSLKGYLYYHSGGIDGTIRRWFDGQNKGIASGLFPLYDQGDKKFVSIEFTSSPSTGGALIISYINSTMGTSGIPIAVSPFALCSGFYIYKTAESYWKIDDDNSIQGGKYDIKVDAEGFIGINDLCELALLQRDGSVKWALAGNKDSTMGTVFNPIVKASNITGWGSFGLGGSVYNPLPIEISNFEVKQVNNNQHIELVWTTVSETNNAYFKIQKSYDKTKWISIGKIKGSGNSNMENHYSFIDSNPQNGTTFYRLMQIDFDGNFSYSNAVKIEITNLNNNKFTNIYPNPFSSEITIEVINSPKFDLEVLTIEGKMIFKKDTDGSFSNLDLNFIPRGVYIFKVHYNNKTDIHRVIKQ